MRINAADTLAGYPILTIRKLLRRLQDEHYLTDSVEEILKINKQEASLLLQELERKSLIEQVTNLEGELCWTNTENGNQLALATAAQPIKRETATQRIKDLLDRVKQANENPDYLYTIKKIDLFGSYLSNQDRINDVDISIKLDPKINDPQQLPQKLLDRAHKAAEKGKQFNSFMERLMWPENEIILFLKSGSRVLSLHDMDDEILELADKETIYDIDNASPENQYSALEKLI